MRRTILILPALLYLFLMPLYAQEDQRFIKANQLYTDGKYEEAAQAYEDILKTGVESPELYYNLGNAYYKSGLLPQAILNYERAKLLAPQDKDIEYNLELARSQTIDKIDKVGEFFLKTWIRALRNKADSDTWAYMSIGFFLGLIGMLFLFYFSRTPALKKAGFFSGILFLFLFIVSFSFAHLQKQKLVNRNYAIIFAPTVNVKSSPDSGGTELFVLHEGTKVKILDKVGEWRQIEISDGNRGWINVSTIEVI
ncbi:MAG: SH3 domain-containing protein [Chlorobi bacterium]|nr:SH3 domain-containing protein [Chlorobiota bacterium]